MRPAAREPVQKPPTPRLFGVLFSLMSSWIGQRHESAIAAFLAGIGEKRTYFDNAAKLIAKKPIVASFRVFDGSFALTPLQWKEHFAFFREGDV